MATLTVEILTPEAALWTGTASSVTARSSEGDFTVMAQYAPTVGEVAAGVVRVATDQGELHFVVHGGFFQVGPDGPDVTRATVLAGVAEPVSSLDAARAERAKERAEAALASSTSTEAGDEAQLNATRAELARAELRLSVIASSAR